MSRIEFDWQEGEQPFDSQNAEFQPPSSFAPPGSEAAAVETEPARGRHVRLSNLALLLVGVALGIGAGFLILGAQGQGNARADFAPLVALQFQALAQGDGDLYGSLIEPEDELWRLRQTAALAQAALLYDLDGEQPRVRRVKLQGDFAEVEIEFDYGGERYRRLETLRLERGEWRLARVSLGGWGTEQMVEGDNLTLHYRERDAFLAAALPQFDAIVKAFCERYALPDPCHVDLTIGPDPNLLPFVPGQGAVPPPPFTRYRIMGLGDNAGDTTLVTANGTGSETHDAAFRARLLEWFPGVDDINRIYLAKRGSDAALAASAERLFGRSAPVAISSPRQVGLRGETPHPLWSLTLADAIGDALARRMLGPITGPDEAALAVWVAARGDAALWAERFSGVQMPDSDVYAPTPLAVGDALIAGDAGQRNAARSFALFLHARYGEETTLAFLQEAGQHWEAEAMFAPLETSPAELAEAWRVWLEN